jgi:hypothetical protein
LIDQGRETRDEEEQGQRVWPAPVTWVSPVTPAALDHQSTLQKREGREHADPDDLALSLLQLLGIQNVANAFMGVAMFSDRAQFQGGFAFAWGRDITSSKFSTSARISRGSFAVSAVRT